MARKITTGVEKAYYAILKEDGDTPVYNPVSYLQGLREFSIVANEEESSIYAENRLWESENALGAIEVTLDFASIYTEDYVALLGKKLSTTGGIIEGVDDQAPYIALMLEKTLSGGVKEYLTLFKGKLRIPEDKGKTKEGSTEYQTQSLNGTFMALNNGQWKHTVKSDDVNFNAVTHANTWGKSVIIPKVLEMPELKITPAPVHDATNVPKTDNITLTSNNALISYEAKLLNDTQQEVASAISIDQDKKVITINPNQDLVGQKKHTISLHAKDIFGQVINVTYAFTTAQ